MIDPTDQAKDIVELAPWDKHEASTIAHCCDRLVGGSLCGRLPTMRNRISLDGSAGTRLMMQFLADARKCSVPTTCCAHTMTLRNPPVPPSTLLPVTASLSFPLSHLPTLLPPSSSTQPPVSPSAPGYVAVPSMKTSCRGCEPSTHL